MHVQTTLLNRNYYKNKKREHLCASVCVKNDKREKETSFFFCMLHGLIWKATAGRDHDDHQRENGKKKSM